MMTEKKNFDGNAWILSPVTGLCKRFIFGLLIDYPEKLTRFTMIFPTLPEPGIPLGRSRRFLTDIR